MTITLTPENFGHARDYVRQQLDGAHWSGSNVGTSLSEVTGYAGRITSGQPDADVHAELASHDAAEGSGTALEAFARWLEERGYVQPDVETPEVPAITEDTTFDAYHPSMLPMIEKLSATADAAGYCAEYDRMARSIGAPTRAEVRRIVQARDGARRRVSFPLTVNVIFDTEDAVHSDADALALMRSKFGTWDGIQEVIANSIQTNRWSAIPTGGDIPSDATVVTL